MSSRSANYLAAPRRLRTSTAFSSSTATCMCSAPTATRSISLDRIVRSREVPWRRIFAQSSSTMIASGRASSAAWSRCEPIFGQWRICALAPVAELHALRNELVRIGEMEGRSLALWLIVAAIGSLVIFAGIMLFLSQRITRPLLQITEAVRAVARGDWKSEVTGTKRPDEVGDIARAVIVLQRSLQERDRLRSDVAHAESVKKRREALDDAIRRFDRIMRSVLLSVSNSVETMDETARELARVSAVAEGET